MYHCDITPKIDKNIPTRRNVPKIIKKLNSRVVCISHPPPDKKYYRTVNNNCIENYMLIHYYNIYIQSI